MSDPGWSVKKVAVMWGGGILLLLIIGIVVVLLGLNYQNTQQQKFEACIQHETAAECKVAGLA